VAPSPLQADRARRGVRSPRSLIVRMARRGGARSASNTTAQRPPRPTPCSRAQGVIMRYGTARASVHVKFFTSNQSPTSADASPRFALPRGET
jgi:hypothetical protein